MKADQYDWVHNLPRAVGHTHAAYEGPSDKTIITATERQAAYILSVRPHGGVKAVSLNRAGIGHVAMTCDSPVVFDHFAVATIVGNFSKALKQEELVRRDTENELRRAQSVISDQARRINLLRDERTRWAKGNESKAAACVDEISRLRKQLDEANELLEESGHLLDAGAALAEADALQIKRLERELREARAK